ncbi:four-carbon acid sugar kinase family protein [Symbiobacterium terraclitae]|uniref:four-carbon acid sugar kinase family protein n=1 Tax=Symbiobacterium terraclitae TaxID=557451 RepID=UPI0035B5525D
MSGHARAPRPLVGVVADDITGAGDIGVMFAKHGYAVRIFGAGTDLSTLPQRLAGRRTDVIIIDTDSRMDAPSVAYAKVRRATAALVRAGCGLFWKKTCSVFRGNVGPEFDALFDELDHGFALAVAAFPKNGRATRDGCHYVHGRPLAESEFARDPVHPRTESNLVADLQRQTGRKVGLIPLAVIRRGPEAIRAAMGEAQAAGVAYALCDGETQADLAAIARAAAAERVLLGASALAEELPAVWEPVTPYSPLAGLELDDAAGVLVIAGSVMPQTQAQVAAAEAAGARVFTLTSAEALRDPAGAAARLARAAADGLRGGANVVVRSENRPDAVDAARALGASLGMDGVAVSRRISAVLASVAKAALAETGARRLITLGGDTSAAVCRELGVDETVVLAEIAPGLPSSLVPGERPLLLVLKSGSFGGPEFVNEAIAHLSGLGR